MNRLFSSNFHLNSNSDKKSNTYQVDIRYRNEIQLNLSIKKILDFCSGRQVCHEEVRHVAKKIDLWLRTKSLIVCVFLFIIIITTQKFDKNNIILNM
jgi:hypothetical protein